MRFSLRGVFVSVFCIAVFCAIVFAVPAEWSMTVQIALLVFVPAVVTSGAVYSRGYVRAFWLGCASTALFPYVLMGYFGFMFAIVVSTSGWDDMSDIGSPDEISAYRLLFALGYVIIFVAGCTAAVVRWLLLRHQDSAAPTPEPQSVLFRRVMVERSDL